MSEGFSWFQRAEKLLHDGWVISCICHSQVAWPVTNRLLKGLHTSLQDPAVPLQPTYYIFTYKSTKYSYHIPYSSRAQITLRKIKLWSLQRFPKVDDPSGETSELRSIKDLQKRRSPRVLSPSTLFYENERKAYFKIYCNLSLICIQFISL